MGGRVMLEVGAHVRFKNILDENAYLNGETGIIDHESTASIHAWVVRLDRDMPGHNSSTAWAYASELEEIPE
jgi:hypothetical protein